MPTLQLINEDQLVTELWARDVRFLMGSQSQTVPLLTPTNLIASLTQSKNARMRFSLIPLFLRHPEFSAEVKNADNLLSPQVHHRNVLRFYYTAAVFLQRKYQKQLTHLLGEQPKLPDLFSNVLGVSSEGNPVQVLERLAKQHQVSCGQSVNWIGTYEHAANVWLKQMELQKA
jgi:hypothetical protein